MIYPKQTKEDIDKLMVFYAVDTLEGLVDAQVHHIERLLTTLDERPDPRRLLPGVSGDIRGGGR